MIRPHDSVVVYREQIAWPDSSREKLEAFERWLSVELAVLEERWISWATPRTCGIGRQEAFRH